MRRSDSDINEINLAKLELQGRLCDYLKMYTKVTLLKVINDGVGEVSDLAI